MEQNIRRQVSRTPSGLSQGPSPQMTLPPYQLHQYSNTGLPSIPNHHGLPNVSLPQSYRQDGLRLPTTSGAPVSSYGSTPHYAPHTPIQTLPPSMFAQTTQAYQPPHNLIPNSTQGGPYHQPIAPAPPRLPNLHPLQSPNPAGRSNNWPSQVPQGQGAPQEQPKHVVGSQGRRGILPSAPGRSPVATNGTNGSAKSTTIPAKDANGKYPCPNCNKTYLHAKHLKRHMLRHTGDRPYMCALCQDTFSRSDILKRHFQKCSIRRGNPTGMSHLSHPQAHVKKNGAASAKQATNGVNNQMLDTDGSNSLVNGTYDPNSGAAPLSFNQPGFIGGTQGPYHSTMVASSNGSNLNSNGHAEYPPRPSIVTQPQWLNKQHVYSHPPSPITPTDFQSNILSSANHSNLPISASQSLSLNAPISQPSNAWAFQRGAEGNFMVGSSLAPAQDSANATSHKQMNPLDPHQDGAFNDFYLASTGYAGDGASNFSLLNFDTTQLDPLQNRASKLVGFCFPYSHLSEVDANSKLEMASFLTADNVKHLLEQFAHFHGHFPILHLSTFNFMKANDGLVLAIMCIGAIYSSRISPSQVRILMHRTKAAIERTSSVYLLLQNNPTLGTQSDCAVSPMSPTQLEEIQALLFMQLLFTWHGDPTERASGRADILMYKRIVRYFGLQTCVPHYSILHQPHLDQIPHPSNWDYPAWVEQETRSRLMFMMFLIDCAMAMYFNCPPMFQASEMNLPLPADDAAFDAKDATECANALGLNGPAAQSGNVSGSRLPKQLEMSLAMKMLLNPNMAIPLQSTNVYSKFILIHALHVHIWIFQRNFSIVNMNNSNTFHDTATGFQTPTSQHDWYATGGNSGHSSRNSSGRVTPTDSQNPNSQSQSMIKATTIALGKWKDIWDKDMAAQYPPSQTAYRRFGFCRDALHFYYLAQIILHPNRVALLQAQPDQRFKQVIGLLKEVRRWAATDAAQRGEEIGSVGDIDPSYGLEESDFPLTLNMKMLFRPINQQIDSPVNGVQTNMDRY